MIRKEIEVIASKTSWSGCYLVRGVFNLVGRSDSYNRQLLLSEAQKNRA
jgi:hypothetical protein